MAADDASTALSADTLAPAAVRTPESRAKPRQPPAAAVAAALASQDLSAGDVILHLASSERRADEIGRALRGMAPDAQVLVLEPWDCLPFDRASPSRDVMARRMRVLEALSTPATGRRFMVVSAEAILQRLPPPEVLAAARFELAPGQHLNRAALAAFASACGYVADDRIDEPGEIAMLGEVIDVFPGDAGQPVRVVLDGDVITALRVYDPLTQRSTAELDTLVLGPASELILADSESSPETGPRLAGVEHGLAGRHDHLVSLFDLLPEAQLSRDDKSAERIARFQDQLAEAVETQRLLGDAERAASAADLYLTEAELETGLGRWISVALHHDGVDGVLNLAGARNPGRAFCDLVQAQQAAGRRVVLSGLPHETRALARALKRGLELMPTPVALWADALTAAPGDVVAVALDLDAGFVAPAQSLAVIAAADVLGDRLAERKASSGQATFAEPELRLGDVVIHEDHGVGVLRALETVVVDGHQRETLKLEYAGGNHLLAPIEEIGRIWRYGAEASAVTLDRLKGEGWIKRRAEVSRHIDETARQLVELVKARDALNCPPVIPPKVSYSRFSARFAFPETPDQAAAISSVLDDLASGKPMDRLVCGDVGFGKTEVALRAAAAVALSGRQVVVVTPTTVLARQHLQTFERRFAGTGVRVAQLSRLVSAAKAKAVREAMAAGEVDIVVGTHAIAGQDATFHDLGLMIIDEEQKFGSAIKQSLRDLGADGHILTLTATPIPRTLQAAMVGLQTVSVIASPPARRRPIRTFLAPFDSATVRTALLREKRRGGQSFVVVPRIEDIEPLSEQLRVLAPELTLRIAHGGLSAEEVDHAMVTFADGDGDILLATNIIESGLDVPRANTMLVWRPDRFGLSQLHQLRGRVGRGRVQGVAYLLSDPNDDLSEATRARLSTLEAFDRLGSGLAISMRDLDLRGGGDLVGDDQAGHMQMIGAALYQRALERALRQARGETEVTAWTPALNIGETGFIPGSFVPDPTIRLNVYARLSRLETLEAIDDFEEELADRFGPLPDAAATLLARARLERLAINANIARVSAGPKGVALTLAHGRWPESAQTVGGKVTEDQLVLALAAGADRLQAIERALLRLAA